MKHNAHILDVEGPRAAVRAARLAGFGASSGGLDGPHALLRLDELAAADAAGLARAAAPLGLAVHCERRGGAVRALVPGDRGRFAALAAALVEDAGGLAAEVQALLAADACREHAWGVRGRSLRTGARTLVVGVVNVTPDSFSDGGRYHDTGRAVERGLALVEAGADLVDVGGESTRPGAGRVDAVEERERVIPVIRALSRRTDATISVDTSRAAVAREALDAGARVVNDVSALAFDGAMASVVAASGAGLIVMHMQGTPAGMQDDPAYHDVVGEILAHLRRALDRAAAAGVDAGQVVVDPGIGFGKTLEHNLALLRHAGSLRATGRPVLVGASRKRFLEPLTGRAVGDRLAGSLAAAAAAVAAGASLLRVHDAAETVDAVRVLDAVRGGAEGAP